MVQLRAVEERTLTQLRVVEERTGAELRAVEERTMAELRAVEERTLAQLRVAQERTAALMAAEIGSLHTDMEHRFGRVEARFDSIDARLKLQAGLIQSGARAMARFSEFSENSEQRWVDLDVRVRAIERRLGNGASGT